MILTLWVPPKSLTCLGWNNTRLLLDTHILLCVAAGSDQLSSNAKPPFDRMLLSQTLAEGVTLVTADSLLAQNPMALISV